jgi:hypothetical protein
VLAKDAGRHGANDGASAPAQTGLAV